MGSSYILRKGVSSLGDLKDGVLASLPFIGNKYFVDPANGSDGNDGTDYAAPMKTILAAYNKCTDNANDVVFLIGSPTAHNPAAAVTWSKNYTHLVGLSSDVFGLGQRCRIVMLAVTAVTPVITISGSGCVFRNLQIYNEKAAGSAAGCAIVTGSRNYLENVFFMSPVATDAASYSLKMSGSENVFYRCTIGQFTNPRTAASYGLWLHGAAAVSRNKFVECEFLSWGYNADHAHVRVDADIVTVPWVTWFEDCLFHHNATALTQAIDDNSTAVGHQIVFRGHNDVLNAGVVGDVLTYMFAPNPDASISGLLMVTVAET